MDKKSDQKTERTLLNALESARAHSQQLQNKRVQQCWKNIENPCSLAEAMNRLSKNELDMIRKNLDFKGLSSLKKSELVSELVRLVPVHYKNILFTLDQERYDLIKKAANSSGTINVDSDFPLSKAESLRGFSILFPGVLNNQIVLAMPLELTEIFLNTDGNQLQEIVRRNTEWIQLTHGMLYYYGIMEISLIIDKLKKLTRQDVVVREYLNVISSAMDYYGQIENTSIYYLKDHRVFDSKELIIEHKKRAKVEYYPFTKKQLFKAGEPNYIDKTPEMNKFIRFLKERFEITDKETDEMALQLINMINTDAQPNMIIQYLQSIVEFPSFEFVQQLTEKIMELYNNTRMWVLKGHTPSKVFNEEKNYLNPLPSVKAQKGSNVVDIESRRKNGRNNPCHCGSGKKYKKCCGK